MTVPEDRFPKRIGSIVSQLLARRGYAQVFATENLQSLVESEVGTSLAGSVRVGNLRGGKLQIFATDSVALQELTFRKRDLLKRIQKEMPENKVTELRFRIQSNS